ncbi:hypothetical protein ACMD2_11739 [Ananas comosus]|uniref:Uncharacterized protein n=1 Tax=Ananas comosus TaxID=4615 RepID=A0A199UQD0_ANACO|nr:hypothetical protein ACMD2_11739 [Ananas comosus]
MALFCWTSNIQGDCQLYRASFSKRWYCFLEGVSDPQTTRLISKYLHSEESVTKRTGKLYSSNRMSDCASPSII